MEKGKVVKASRLSETNKRITAAVAKALLDGVGQIPSALEQMELAIHYRRSLTDEEIAGLPLDWCAIPPIDEAGNGILLEANT